MKKKKIKLCLAKQLLNMFKLWCEWGMSFPLQVTLTLVPPPPSMYFLNFP